MAEIYENGNMSIGGTLSQNSSFDIAENFIKGETMEPGDVVRIALHSPDTVLLATGRDGEPVLGIVSEKPGIVLGGIGFGPEDIESGWGAKLYSRFNENRQRLAGEIKSVRRALATAETGGEEGPSSNSAEEDIESRIIERFGEENIVPVALSGRVPVKVDASAESVSVGDYLCAGPTPGTAVKAVNPGPVIGLALEGLKQGTGKIMVFVNTGWYGGISEESDELAFEREDPEDPDSAVVVEAEASCVNLVLDDSRDEAPGFAVIAKQQDGESVESANALFSVRSRQGVYTRGAYAAPGLGYAEYHPVTGPVEAGDVLSASSESPGRLTKSGTPEDSAVVGIAADSPSVLAGDQWMRAGDLFPEWKEAYLAALAAGNIDEATAFRGKLESAFIENYAAVALGGTTTCKADAAFGSTAVGDLLTSSPNPGFAMRVEFPAPGTIVAKAMEPLPTGQGTIEVLLMAR